MAAVSGTTKDSTGTLCSKLVRVYRRDTGAFVGQTLSHPTTGTWSVTTADTSKHWALCYDAAGAAATQPYVLAIPGNGPNNGTGIVDLMGHPITATGDAKYSTAQSLFNGSSLVFDGTGDYLSIPDSADWDFGTGDFTIEGYFRFTAHTSNMALLDNYLNSTTGWSWQRRSDTNTIRFGNGDTALLDVSWTPTDAAWYHMAVCRSGTSLRGFVDGTQVGSTVTNSTNITGSTNPLLVGALNASGSFVQTFNGNACGIAIKKEALYTGSFTPPVGLPYTLPSAAENAERYDDLTPV